MHDHSLHDWSLRKITTRTTIIIILIIIATIIIVHGGRRRVVVIAARKSRLLRRRGRQTETNGGAARLQPAVGRRVVVEAVGQAVRCLGARRLEVVAQDLEVAVARQQRVGAGLVRGADAAHADDVGERVEAERVGEGLRVAQQVLDVDDVGEVEVEERREVGELLGQRLARRHAQQVCEVVARVEGDPLDLGLQHEARRDEQLREVLRVDAVVREQVEVDAAVAQQLDAIRRVDVRREVEAEVELPRADGVGDLAALVEQRDAELDHLEQVHVVVQARVVVVLRRLEVADGLRDNAGELGVHRDVGVLDDELAQQAELLLQIVAPDVSNIGSS